MTRGDIFQIVGLIVAVVGLFLVLSLGWALTVVGVASLIIGELIDMDGTPLRRRKGGTT